METDHYRAAHELTRGLLVVAMFLFAMIVFQFFMGETIGVVRSRADEPRAFWIGLGVQIAAFVLLLVLLYFHTR